MTSPTQIRFKRRQGVISGFNVDYVTLDKLFPGAVTVEGIVLERSISAHTYTTPAGTFVVDDPDRQQIAVIARVDDEMLAQAREAVAAR